MNLQTTLTAAIRYDQNLNANEKLLYSELTARMDQDCLCSLSNQEVASLYHVSLCSVSHWFKSLIDYGLVIVVRTKPRLLKISQTPHKKTTVSPTATASSTETKEAKQAPTSTISPKRDYLRNPLPTSELRSLFLSSFKDNPTLKTTEEVTGNQPPLAYDDDKAIYHKENDIKVTDNKTKDSKENFTLATKHKASFNIKAAKTFKVVKLQVKKLGLTKLLYPLLTKLLNKITSAIVNFFNNLLPKGADLTAPLGKL